ncbi:hypothetical protein HPP92_012807 [Vanilla planifolia]|uniref:Uncharacterized protein n=1 Tax=Vanilla planifolia TaxID=51239 RepID=A0A835UY69_VANPL|nr:hypothetical protein HPP92_012807 [Vanilla planifolia]
MVPWTARGQRRSAGAASNADCGRTDFNVNGPCAGQVDSALLLRDVGVLVFIRRGDPIAQMDELRLGHACIGGHKRNRHMLTRHFSCRYEDRICRIMTV